jgi:hypothetical protein
MDKKGKKSLGTKRWYTVSFQAKMDEEDIEVMKNRFYQAMEEMGIAQCVALDIDPHSDQGDD